jgi:LPS-assembly protein
VGGVCRHDRRGDDGEVLVDIVRDAERRQCPARHEHLLADFDDLDEIEARNLVTFALTNTLTARKPLPAETKGPKLFYNPLMRFKLAESFDINKHKEDDLRPFSDLLAELDLTPRQYIWLDGDALWRPYDGRFYGYNAALRLWDLRGDILSVQYRFTREEPEEEVEGVESIRVAAVLQLTQKFGLRGLYERDIETDKLIETGVGAFYRSQCWGVDVNAKEEEERNRSISFMVHLNGLGSFGQ